MCDTVVVVHREGVLFAKNSDRDANEAQLLERHARRRAPPDARLRCTWIEIPDVPETFATLISRPFWMWGAEIGANEHGVTIGNEAVFTRDPVPRTGLTGMDLLRLALERAASAEAAVAVIGELLESHGQGGGCGHESRGFRYHSSFLVADPGGAWILETAGRDWQAERVDGVRTISNALTLPDFARRHAERLRTAVAAGRKRQRRTRECAAGAHGAADLMALLRDHGRGRRWPRYAWLNGSMAAPCVHAGGVVAASQTTASWVADLRPGAPRHWVTGTAAPCLGLFKPVTIDAAPDPGPDPDDRADGHSLWWRHEALHRAVMRDPERLAPPLLSERDALEARWLRDPPAPEVAFKEGDAWLARARERLGEPARDVRPAWVRRYWRERNSRAGLVLDASGRVA